MLFNSITAAAASARIYTHTWWKDQGREEGGGVYLVGFFFFFCCCFEYEQKSIGFYLQKTLTVGLKGFSPPFEQLK